MGKILVLVLVVLAVIFIARTLAAGSRREPAEEEKPERRRVGKEERVVPCAQCGIHVPESAAVAWRGRSFCSDEHRRLFRE
jgi:uncharacterized protein